MAATMGTTRTRMGEGKGDASASVAAAATSGDAAGSKPISEGQCDSPDSSDEECDSPSSSYEECDSPNSSDEECDSPSSSDEGCGSLDSSDEECGSLGSSDEELPSSSNEGGIHPDEGGGKGSDRADKNGEGWGDPPRSPRRPGDRAPSGGSLEEKGSQAPSENGDGDGGEDNALAGPVEGRRETKGKVGEASEERRAWREIPQQHSREPFPIILHRILHDAESDRRAGAISWLLDEGDGDDGANHDKCDSFVVRDARELERDVLPRYFEWALAPGALLGFRRQLDLWGFERPPGGSAASGLVDAGVDGLGGAWRHADFVRGDGGETMVTTRREGADEKAQEEVEKSAKPEGEKTRYPLFFPRLRPMDEASAREASNVYPLAGIREPGPHDCILSGHRGQDHLARRSDHPGNAFFLGTVAELRERIAASSEMTDLDTEVRDLVKAWRGRSPPGRFLVRDGHTGLWSDAGDEKAHNRTSHALREDARGNVMLDDPSPPGIPLPARCSEHYAAGDDWGVDRDDYPLANIERPEMHDCLLDCGGNYPGLMLPPGNALFLAMADERADQYCEASRADKPHVAQELVNEWRCKLTPPGRFLNKDEGTGLWNDVGDERARERACEALRRAVQKRGKACGLPHKRNRVELADGETKGEHDPGRAAEFGKSLDRRTALRARYLVETVANPGPHDCLLGRGGSIHYRSGNRLHRMFARRWRDEYKALKRRADKPALVMKVVKEWREMDPPGRFLRKCPQTGLWTEAGDTMALEKTRASIIKKQISENDDGMPRNMPVMDGGEDAAEGEKGLKRPRLDAGARTPGPRPNTDDVSAHAHDDWGDEDQQWGKMYTKLTHYKLDNGTLVIDEEDNANGKLRSWQKVQESLLATAFEGEAYSLSSERVRKLMRLGYGRRLCLLDGYASFGRRENPLTPEFEAKSAEGAKS